MTLQPFKPRSAPPKKSFPWILTFSLLLAGILLIGILYFFFFSDFFRVRGIFFEGNRLIGDEELSAAVIGALANENRFWGKLLGTDHIFFWHQPAMADLSAQLPLLADLRLAADWRSRKVTFTVWERKMAGVWCFQEGRECFLFDREGFLFGPAPAVFGSLILKVFDENRDQIFVGRQVLAEENERLEFFRIIEILEKADLAVDFAIIKPAADQEWAIKLAAGPELKLSRVLPMAESLTSLAEKIKALPLERIRYIDLTVPNRLYYQ